MAHIVSMGIHTPSALPYCISEGILPDPPSPSSYQWTLSQSVPDEELLVTGYTVIWSQGGIIRRVFKFDVEKESVIQALLTWFPTDEATKSAAKDNKQANREPHKGKKRQSTWNSKSRTYAAQLGSFPRTRQSLTRMTSMIGLEDDDGDDTGSHNNHNDEEQVGNTAKRRALVVCLKNQAHVFYLSGTSYVIHLPFEVQYALAAPNGLLLQRKFPKSGVSNNVRDFPRLFSLTDPLVEVGLVVTQEGGPLDSSEEIIFISNTSSDDANKNVTESSATKSSDILFAVTQNVKKGLITVWHAIYVPQESITDTVERRVPSATGSSNRRRSSYGPGLATGATTPLAPNVSMMSAGESMYNEFNEKTSNRRVSSLVARADLSGTLDRAAFNDLASASSSFLQPPVDDMLMDLNGGSHSFDQMANGMGEGLRNEILMTKIESFPTKLKDGHLQPGLIPRVFTMFVPLSSTDSSNEGRRVILVIVNRADSSVLQLLFQLPRVYPPGTRAYSKRKGSRIATLVDVRRHSARDALKLNDGIISRLLLLTLEGNLNLTAPWCPSINAPLPQNLARGNLHQLGQKQTQKRDFKRTLSATPRYLRRLEFPEDGGRVTIVDENEIHYRLSIETMAREHTVRQALEVVKYVLPAERGGEAISSAWMQIMQKRIGVKVYSLPSDSYHPDEWKAFLVIILSLGVGVLPPSKIHKRRSGLSRISSGTSASWEELLHEDEEYGPQAEYLRSPAWEWLGEIEEQRDRSNTIPENGFMHTNVPSTKNNSIISAMISAREFLSSPEGKAIAQHLPHESPTSEIRRTSFAMLLVGLHLLREEWKLDISLEGAVRRMTGLLVQMSLWLGWSGWTNKYLTEDVEVETWEFDETSQIVGMNIPELDFGQASIHDWLINCLEGKPRQLFLTLQHIVDPNSSSEASDNNISTPLHVKLTPKTKIIIELYSLLMDSNQSYVEIVSRMVKLRVTTTMLERFPEGVALPLWEAILKCRNNPPTSWGEAALNLVGRKDLKMLISNKLKKEASRWSNVPLHEAVRDVHSITTSVLEPEPALGAFDGSAEIDRTIITKLIFSEDLRVQEASKLLQSGKPVAVKHIAEPEWTEHEILENQQELAQQVAIRTLAVPAGRGLLLYSARIPLLTEKFPIQGFNLTCVMKPANTTVSADKASYTEEKVCWAFFHSGVAAGLSISREAQEIESSWIIYNKPPELSNRHAGFLLALGLNGHLKSLAKYHAFNYLTPKHTMTSIGLLLGLSAAYLGTMDTTVTKLLSVHVTRLLPPGSAELNVSGLTQTAGMMGIGLLYYNTQHRRMSEILLSEIEHIDIQDSCVPADNLRDEGYRLAAGFGLGFINLGIGQNLKGLQDMQLVERLLDLAVGTKNVQLIHVLDKATAGATIALALIYMKSGDENLAKKIDIPDTVHMFDYVRPDLFLLRTVAKHLILWDKIRGSMDWVHDGFRPFIRTHWTLDNIRYLDSSFLPILNLAAGLCFSIGLRFAGSGAEEPRDTLLYYLDQFTRLCSLPAGNHDQKLVRATARNCQDLVALSAATVMAGSGDLEVFRRLRRHHGKVDPDVPYGSHFACHLAIGILFMGGGNYTFGTSNLAIACLLLALYPLFPNTVLDNKSHLQAFRHFWVLAIEPRCVVVRDVNTNRPTSIPITIKLNDGSTISKTAPCLLPELSQIALIKTESPNYWSAILDFANNPDHLYTFQRTQTIYIQSRPPQFSSSSVYESTLKALEEHETGPLSGIEWLLSLKPFTTLDNSERALLLPVDVGSANNVGILQDNSVDMRILLERASLKGWNADRLRNVRLLFAFVDMLKGQDKLAWLTKESVDRLRAAVWTAFT